MIEAAYLHGEGFVAVSYYLFIAAAHGRFRV
jgi:hypothetical protein